MMVPNGEHVGGCTRMCQKIYMRNDRGGINQSFMMCHVGGFYSAYEEVSRDNKLKGFLENGPLEFNVVSYEFGEKLLSDAFLNLLILDEAHESLPSIVLSIDAARRMLTGDGVRKNRRLEKFVLMTATMTEDDVRDLRRSFESEGLSFSCITFDEREIPRSKDLKMSCLYTPGEDVPSGFSRTDLSRALDHVDRSYTMETMKGSGDPNMKTIEGRLEVALGYAMRKSGEVVRCGRNPHVPSIVVILPGLDYLEKFFSKVRGMDHFRVSVKGMDGTRERIFHDDAFVPIRITSTVKDDDKVTSPCTVMGSWGGRKGRIIFTTNMIASGLTVPGAAWIIDCGVVKIISEYQPNGLFSLDMEFIDREMMIQRASRTGRTHHGEYCIGLSMKRVKEINESSVRMKQMMRQFEENHWLRMKIHNLDLTWKLDNRIVRRFEKSFQNRGYLMNGQFTPSTLLLAEQFPFLPTDYAWILVQGIRLGLVAHVVLFIADLLFCQVHSFSYEGSREPGRSI
ncbi:hypothetical protein PENTCL1PPCAC_26612 [Pristionchus entomophagus]|uniref:Helicase C-terminal domain-containing protein n=1 Tax=Pristionchus entomophagus TaxID=358040 RepID=A0AAV5UDI2_9BILA|nr:hypothetical protein PENTCL1PPCAC_26612 [Pristionchus entomophagus]